MFLKKNYFKKNTVIQCVGYNKHPNTREKEEKNSKQLKISKLRNQFGK